MNTAYLLTGGNLGNRFNNLNTAKICVEEICGKIISSSSVYETAAWGIKEQPDFYNQAIILETTSSPSELLKNIHVIEKKMGRIREIKYGPRIIDIDILFYNNDVIDTKSLKVPHPFLHERRFALMPLAEIAGNIIHPVLQKTINKLLRECSDDSGVYKISAENF